MPDTKPVPDPELALTAATPEERMKQWQFSLRDSDSAKLNYICARDPTMEGLPLSGRRSLKLRRMIAEEFTGLRLEEECE